MPVNQEEFLRVFEKIMGDDTLTRQEFVEAFERVINLIKQIKEQQQKAINDLENKYGILIDKIRGEHRETLASLKSGLNELFVGDQVKKMNTELKGEMTKLQKMINSTVNKKMIDVDLRMSHVKDGARGFTGPAGSPDTPELILEKLKGRLTIDFISGLKEALQSVSFRRGMGRAKVPMIRIERLTGSVDGNTRAFTLPRDTVRVHGLFSSQFPRIYDENDYSFSGNTLTLGSNIETPRAGQTLNALIETLFYA